MVSIWRNHRTAGETRREQWSVGTKLLPDMGDDRVGLAESGAGGGGHGREGTKAKANA